MAGTRKQPRRTNPIVEELKGFARTDDVDAVEAQRQALTTARSAPPQPTPSPKAPAPAPRRARPRPGTEAVAAMRQSNTQLPVTLIQLMRQELRTRGRTHGEVIIDALEQALDRLPELVAPLHRAPARRRFDPAPTPPAPPEKEPKGTLNYRMTTTNFAVLDDLVAECGARSRAHLITVALREYFRDQEHEV